MTNSRSWALLGAVVLLSACGADEKECLPGATQACACAGGAKGAQTCQADGKSWGACGQCAGSADASPTRDSGAPDQQVVTSDGGADDAACGGGLSRCGKGCVDLKKDNANCGLCGTACKGGEVCQAGACVLSCQTGLTNCSGTCVSLTTDRFNCGACGSKCKAGQVCNAANCSLTCQSGLTNCSGACANLKQDTANCGACGGACQAGELCSAGKCALTCQSGLANCSGTCVNLKTDRFNCGACTSQCKAGQVCSTGSCALSCQSGLTDCNSTCVNLQSDNGNCGACGTTCKAGEKCSTGKCALTCLSGLTDCNSACVNLKQDIANCGACGTSCIIGQTCAGGGCVTACGNNKVDPGEQCDGALLWGKDCKALGLLGGVLACSSKCTFDITGCWTCGDGKINGVDQCDGKQLGGKSCKTQGHDHGTLACTSACKLDASGCGKCTDKAKNGDESDVDCGGSCTRCAAGKKCKLATDCASGSCSQGVCALPTSCKALLAARPGSSSGVHTIDPNGGNASDAFAVWCDMTTNNGGWTLVMSTTHTTKWSCGSSIWHDASADTFTVTPTKEGKSRAYNSVTGAQLLFKTHKELPGYWAAFKMPASKSLRALVGTTNISSRSNGYLATLTKLAVGPKAHKCWGQSWRVTWKNYWSSDNHPDSAIFAPAAASSSRPCGGAASYATGVGVRTDTNNGFSGYGGSFEGYGSDGAGNKAVSGGYVSIYVR